VAQLRSKARKYASLIPAAGARGDGRVRHPAVGVEQRPRCGAASAPGGLGLRAVLTEEEPDAATMKARHDRTGTGPLADRAGISFLVSNPRWELAGHSCVAADCATHPCYDAGSRVRMPSRGCSPGWRHRTSATRSRMQCRVCTRLLNARRPQVPGR
jgi:hypothetical protein